MYDNGALFPGALTDVGGVYVGHATDRQYKTGVTAVLTPEGAVCGVDVRGAAPGTRETDLLKPGNLVDKVHAVMLCGGSAFGLDAVAGAMAFFQRRRIGFASQYASVPIIPAAVLYDIHADTASANCRPTAAMGALACIAAGCGNASQSRSRASQGSRIIQGRVGAGTGATVGKMVPRSIPSPGGIGTATLKLMGYTVAALVAVNAVGDIYHPHTGGLLASGSVDGTPVTVMSLLNAGSAESDESGIGSGESAGFTGQAGENTTIGVIATDAPLNREQVNRMATVGHDGYALAIRPVHTSFDGDTLFALATGSASSEPILQPLFAMLCASAVEVVARAIANAAVCARGKICT